MGLLPQPHKALEVRLVGVLAGHVLRTERGGDAGIFGRVVPVHVDAVEHAEQLVLTLAHNALHPVGEIGHFQLVGVCRRHGVNGVGAENRAL